MRVQPLVQHCSTFVSVRRSYGSGMDVLFKNLDLSKKAKFMFGVGPEWIHITENGVSTNSVAGEIALDFMLWPSPKRRLGWYIEQAYDYRLGRGHDQAIGVSVGLLISIR
jgi:hypothetical protein